jgi:hypothetical protein
VLQIMFSKLVNVAHNRMRDWHLNLAQKI